MSIFDFEQSIMQAWNTKDDIDLLSEYVLEKNLTKDEICNALIGLSSLHQMRCEKTFDMFEKFCAEYWKYKKFYEKMESARDDLK